MSTVALTPRLRLRRLQHDDDGFVVRLLNTPGFLAHIGDRGVRTAADARRWLDDGPLASYDIHGFGLFMVELRHGSTPVGICGPLRRDGLPAADLGYALLPEHCGRGYAVEAGAAVLELAGTAWRMDTLLAIVATGNPASVSVLQRLGFRAAGQVRLAPGAEPLDLFRRELGDVRRGD